MPPTRTPYDRSPVYIDAPDYHENAIYAVLLHELCNRLNQSGIEAYLQGCTKLNGRLWTPALTRTVKAAHYLAQKSPVSITAKGAASQNGKIGLSVEYAFDGDSPPENGPGQLLIHRPGEGTPPRKLPLRLPLANTDIFHDAAFPNRTNVLVYAEAIHSAGGKLRPAHAQLHDISPSQAGRLSPAERAELFQQARCLLAYETGAIVAEARLCGCPVIYISNDVCLKTQPTSAWDMVGATWNDETIGLDALREETQTFRRLHDAMARHAEADLTQFIEESQALAREMTQEDAWPDTALESIQDLVIAREDRARVTDQTKYRRLQEQYTAWRERSSLREIDAQIYAEHIVLGQLPSFGAVIDARQRSMDSIARTLDSLGAGFLKPAVIGVLAPFDCPVSEEDLGPQVCWIKSDAAVGSAPWQTRPDWPAWTLVVEASTELEPHAVAEFALSAQGMETKMVYCDDDAPSLNGGRQPHFKPDLNIEWLRCVNYLGQAVAVRTTQWLEDSPVGGLDGIEGLYGLALQWASQTPKGIAHIDTVLAHADGQIPTSREASEMAQVRLSMHQLKLQATMQPGKALGVRQIEYIPATERSVSMIVPSGYQLGYLKCLLQSVELYPEARLREIIVVVQPEHQEGALRLIDSLALPLPIKVITANADRSYNHAAALNAGAAAASGDLLLFMDDDTEWIQQHWLTTLAAYFDQSDVACVAPRLVLHVGDDATLQAGPLAPHFSTLLTPYNGERQLLEEQGVFSRLQTSQDVIAVGGSCFLTSRSIYDATGGFDEEKLTLFAPVQDYCLRSLEMGYRHVWTPVSNVLHHGSKTMAALQREPEYNVQWQSTLLTERQTMLERWGKTIAHNGLYNRHLSLTHPHDIEADIVVDWNPKRPDRPRVLALPISSGSGQYRIIEPLNALQDAGLAQTCAVIPLHGKGLRTPTPLELLRVNPDRLIVQHSIADVHFRLLREYRKVIPDLFIIQMVDDLFRDLSPTHPNYRIHQREGEVRMGEALSLCNRLIVSTQPLADAYRQYCPDVVVMPNCLNDNVWGAFFKAPTERLRLRVGWAGAAQHLGDLDMIQDVVAALAPDVDWIFMGMCPDSLRPYIHEFHPFVSYTEYPTKLASLDLDIAIAPLEDTAFNESKSNLRLLEYGAMGWPVVCSDVYPFRTANPPVIRLPNVSDQWINTLRRLIEDRKERLSLGSELHHWVEQRFFISKNAGAWQQAIFH